MNLIIDIGNTRVKVCLFDGELIIKQGVDDSLSVDFVSLFCFGFEIENVIISAVSEGAKELYDYFKHIYPNTIILDATIHLPIVNLYETPQSLGHDRIAAAVGANELFPIENVLVIDAGTAITIDFITSKNQFVGGNISPGLNTRFKSLHNYTNKLPLLKSKEIWPILGNNTETAIISGVQQGIVFEIEGYISYFKTQYGAISVVLTGGDSEIFAKQINHTVNVEPYLVFKGLNRIIQYNANNK